MGGCWARQRWGWVGKALGGKVTLLVIYPSPNTRSHQSHHDSSWRDEWQTWGLIAITSSHEPMTERGPGRLSILLCPRDKADLS